VRPLRLPNADVVYLAPPLVVQGADLDVLLSAVASTLPG
jgi:adenosylmethionine-8-amino-7-oxononanoate aminotransferase